MELLHTWRDMTILLRGISQIIPAPVMVNKNGMIFTEGILWKIVAIICVFFVGVVIRRMLINEKSVKKQLVLEDEELLSRNESICNMLIDKNTLLQEKELLLAKVHHRVKNNLQVVMSLLSAQSAYLQNPAAKVALIESQVRLQTMVIIHKKLYGKNDIDLIEMDAFINELFFFMSQRYHTAGFKLILFHDIHPVQLDVTQAIVIGLLINEAIDYAVKFEFSGLESAEIQIKLNVLNEKYLKLIISYQGIDVLSYSAAREKRLKYSVKLMSGLCGQIGSRPQIEQKNGMHITVLFQRLSEEFTTLKLNAHA